jgi:methylamine utilization protein MauE
MDPVVDAMVRAGLTLLLGAAAAHKLRDPATFAATLAEYRVLPPAVVPAVARLVPLVEAAVALGLATSIVVGPAAAACLLAVYATAIGLNLARGRRDLDCGCGGPGTRRPIGTGLVVRNVALAAAALAVARPPASRELVWIDGLTVVAGTIALAAAYVAVDRLVAQAPALARLRGTR